MKKLTGITWNNTRGYLPKVATAQRFGEMHPDIQIEWRKRHLDDFAHYPVDRLAQEYDLIDLDHPSIGLAAARQVVLPLEDFVPAEFLADQAANSVGPSHASYEDRGRHWALAIDAATPVSSCRPDLLASQGRRVPETWDELMDLARTGVVILPAVPVDCLMALYLLCLALGEQPFLQTTTVISRDVGHAALKLLQDLVRACPPECLERNPIQTYQAMTASTRYAYCPFGFGYSHFSREGYARHPLRFGGLVTYGGRRLRSTLGGTGLAVSAGTKEPEAAFAYARYVASPECQRSIYFFSGGQPGHRAAWKDPAVNQACSNYFINTLQTLDEAYLRPRYAGHVAFQEQAGVVVHEHVSGKMDAGAALARLDEIYRHSRQP